jgi:large subunit ribosomal protein L10
VPKVELKQVVVDEIKGKIEGAVSIVLVNHRGLTVEQDTKLRKSLRDANVTYKVYKNSMMRFAFKGTDFEALDGYLAGPSAIAISYDDATAGARVLAAAAKEFKALEFKAGVVEGEAFDVDGIKKIAQIPPRDQLLAKLLGSLQSPIAKFARTMKALSEKVEETGSENAGSLGTEKPIEDEKAPEAKIEEVKVEAPVAEAKVEAKVEEVKEEAKVEAKAPEAKVEEVEAKVEAPVAEAKVEEVKVEKKTEK